jgi:hypothetical protein
MQQCHFSKEEEIQGDANNSKNHGHKGEGGVLILNFLPSGIIVNTKTNLKIGNSNSMNSS